ncbi:LIC10415 family protein [Leptospira terpstrae]|uniref:Uncharacterized protein n=1 Tax=Leptospira terpstrae serovar Hualin str. LT 11-33 = ATCC 700639 TaxID=1257025 RepID=N1W272_9LEPT|nr:hypothetical protein [Leptospira terpstrae]EMY63345.1 hypothetical protein LEP1GSC203_2852 [Leptospira terpstrae serovar Hualin str. LT 11-33 = ATCC 700639]
MDVRLNRLLNSAEKLVQDKKDTKDVSSGKTGATVQKSDEKSDFVVSLPVQYHNIQSRLTELQKQLSKEQSRIGLLEDANQEENKLKELLFEGEPLFPELGEGKFTKPEILENSKGNISSLLAELKKKEVEGENIFSLGMMLSPEEFKGKIGSVSTASMKPISETMVKRLLGG